MGEEGSCIYGTSGVHNNFPVLNMLLLSINYIYTHTLNSGKKMSHMYKSIYLFLKIELLIANK